MKPKFKCAITISALLLLSCGGESVSQQFQVSRAWSRPTPRLATAGVVYLTVVSDREDVLVDVKAPTSIAGAAELHSPILSSGGESEHQHGGVTQESSEIDFVVAPESPLELEPNGKHIMLVGLLHPLETGMVFDLMLEFSSGRELTATVAVTENPPGE